MACLHQEDLSKPVATTCWWRGCTDKLEYPNYGLMITKKSRKHALHLVPAYHTGCQYLGELVTRVGKSGAGPKASTPGVVGHLKEPNKLLQVWREKSDDEDDEAQWTSDPMEPNFALTGSVHETLLLMYVDVKLFLSLPRKIFEPQVRWWTARNTIFPGPTSLLVANFPHRAVTLDT